MKNTAIKILGSTLCAGSLLVGVLSAQPTSPTIPAAVNSAPQNIKLTPEERQKFAKARETVFRDPEYVAAVKRLKEAQAAVDQILYSKLLLAAPELSAYIRKIRDARGVTASQNPN